MGTERYRASVQGGGNAINIGGQGNIASVNNISPEAGGALAAAVEAVRALAVDVDGPARAILLKGAQQIESAKSGDKAGLTAVLELVQAAISGVSGSVASVAAATKAVADAMASVGS